MALSSPQIVDERFRVLFIQALCLLVQALCLRSFEKPKQIQGKSRRGNGRAGLDTLVAFVHCGPYTGARYGTVHNMMRHDS